ncbi:hypothetical protein OTU49_008514 [Cherax quadricarinatus]|uniref:CHK kinase-like domain-containing protein n=2 Tax=Cherax quadricarinatus TaxID=27406 RepID=A0AAW0WQI2_CHEQU
MSCSNGVSAVPETMKGQKAPQVQEALVREALQYDQGQDARLLSWSSHYFTNKGDNYVAVINSVSVKFSKDGCEQEVSYVVKMKQLQNKTMKNDFDDMVFQKEGKFYTDLMPLINHELTAIGQDPLRVPRCLHDDWDEKKDQLFLEDLRHRGFKLHDRKQALSVPHAALVLRELARLHAVSFLVLSKISKEQLASKFKFLTWAMYNYSEQTKKAFHMLISGSLQTASELAEAAGREDMSEWFRTLASQGTEVLINQTGEASVFDVISHGDCWINNLLFRDDNKGDPIEVMLLDFQLCRKTSLAFDLNYFLFSSLVASDRNDKLEHLLATYHTSFKDVMEAAEAAMPFTLAELTKEFYRRNIVGLIYGALAIPALVCEAQDAQEFDVSSDKNTHKYVVKKRQNALNMLKTNSLMPYRLASLYEDVRLYTSRLTT